MANTLFHSGEKYIQTETGESFIASRNAAMVTDKVAGGAAIFLQTQQFMYAASMDGQGGVWASVLSGSKGFISLTDQQHLTLDSSLLLSDKDDIFWTNIAQTPGVGLLFIEMISRRRLRINGHIMGSGDSLLIRIDQAYPNCPKYIQRREFRNDQDSPGRNSHDLKDWLSRTDTIFVASADADGNLDISHRGGNTGFVHYVDENTLRVPDYQGNSMFNTLGNFHVNPVAGLLLLDFSNGETLQLSGRAIVHLNESTDIDTSGTMRFWDFKIDQLLFRSSLIHFSSRFIDFSPYNP